MVEIHWRGLIAPLNKPDAVGRKIVMGSTPKARPLPLPLRYAPADWGGHAGAVAVGSIERVWVDSNNLWGEGRFDLYDQATQEVVRKVKNGFVRHISADIEPSTGKLMAATIVDIPAFEDAEIKSIHIPDDDESGLDVPTGSTDDFDSARLVAFAFRVVGDTGLPFSSRGREWSSSDAVARVLEWAGGPENVDVNRFRQAFLYQAEGADPGNLDDYQFPFADVVDGRLVAVPSAVFALAGSGGVDATNIPESDKETIRRRVSALYRRMSDDFGDPSLVSPFEHRDFAVIGEQFASASRLVYRELALLKGGM